MFNAKKNPEICVRFVKKHEMTQFQHYLTNNVS